MDEGANLAGRGRDTLRYCENYIDKGLLSMKRVLEFIRDSAKGTLDWDTLPQLLQDLERHSYIKEEERADIIRRIDNHTLSLNGAQDIMDNRDPYKREMKEHFSRYG